MSSFDANGFQRYVMPYMGSNMYLTIEGTSALIIDPHPSGEMEEYLLNRGIGDVTVFLTHEHFDHTSGVQRLRTLIGNVQVIAHQEAAKILEIPRNNRPLALLKLIDAENREEILSYYRSFPVVSITVDRIVVSGDVLSWHGRSIRITHCPGHSPGSILLHVSPQLVFTGDYMIEGVPVILRYPGGSEEAYKEKTLPYLLRLEEETYIFPGHGEFHKRGDLVYRDKTFWKMEE